MWQKNPVFDFVLRIFCYCFINYLLPPGSIVRMNTLQSFLPGRQTIARIETVHAIPLAREMQRTFSTYLPNPTSGMRELLRLGQIGLALPQLFFSSLALGNLKAKILIGSGQLCCSICDLQFKITSSSPDSDHQERKNDKRNVISHQT